MGDMTKAEISREIRRITDAIERTNSDKLRRDYGKYLARLRREYGRKSQIAMRGVR